MRDNADPGGKLYDTENTLSEKGGIQGMSRISARLIGREIGKNAKEVYLLLEKLGFIKKGSGRTMNGSPVWELTDLGRQHGEDSHNPYSLGFIWDSEVVDILKKVFKL